MRSPRDGLHPTGHPTFPALARALALALPLALPAATTARAEPGFADAVRLAPPPETVSPGEIAKKAPGAEADPLPDVSAAPGTFAPPPDALAGLPERDAGAPSLPTGRGPLDDPALRGALADFTSGLAGDAASAGAVEEPSQLANFQRPLLHKEMPDKGPGAGLEGLEDLIPKGPGSDPFGGWPGGGAGSDPGGGWPGGGEGGDPFGGLPGGDLGSDPFGGGDMSDLRDPLAGSWGDDEPGPGGFVPGSGPPGAEMEGGGSGDFFEWTFLPFNDDPGYQRAREMTEMNDAADRTEPLTYVPDEPAPPREGSDDDGFAQATTSDYDERDEDAENFAEAQSEFEAEKKKQEEARRKVNGSTGLTTGEDSGGGPDRDTPDPKYDPGQISSFTEDQTGGGGGGNPADGGLTQKGQEALEGLVEKLGVLSAARMRQGAEVVTDPPEHDPGGNPGTAGSSQ